MTLPKDKFGESPPNTLEPRLSNGRIGLAQAGAIGLVAIFLIALVFYGLTTNRGGTPASTVTSQGGAQTTTQPAPTNAANNPVIGRPAQGLVQPATPSQNAAAPSGLGNPPQTTG